MPTPAQNFAAAKADLATALLNAQAAGDRMGLAMAAQSAPGSPAPAPTLSAYARRCAQHLAAEAMLRNVIPLDTVFVGTWLTECRWLLSADGTGRWSLSLTGAQVAGGINPLNYSMQPMTAAMSQQMNLDRLELAKLVKGSL